MKYKILGLLFIIACLVFLFYLNDDQKITEDQSIPAQLKPYKAEFEELDELSKTQPKEAEKKIKTLIKKLPKKSQRWFDFGVKAGKVSVGFYGKVIDQYGKPLEGVKVHFYVTGSYLSHGSGKGFVTTNSSGIFHTKGSGAVLYIENFIHPSIEFIHDPEKLYRGEVLDWYKYRKENPKVYKVWRTEKYEHVFQSNKSIGGGRGTITTVPLTFILTPSD